MSGDPYPGGDAWLEANDLDPWSEDPEDEVAIPAQREPWPEELVEPSQTGVAGERLARLRRLMVVRSALDDIRPPAWIIDSVLSDEALSLLSGKFGTYKTFVALGWACSVATGVPWFGHPVKRDGPVVYIAAEGLRGLRSRVREWEIHNLHGARIPDDRLIVIGGPMQLNHLADVEAVCQVGTELHPAMVVWDTLHRCAPGVEENSNTDMGKVVHQLARIRDTVKCTQLVLHHTGHAGVRSRGASNLEDDFEDSWVIALGGDGEDRAPENPRTMRHRKAKDFTLSGEIGLHLEVGPDGGARVVERTAEDDARSEEYIVRARIMAALDAARVPLTAGRDAVRRALLDAGIKMRNEDLAELVRTRKATPVSPPLPLGLEDV